MRAFTVVAALIGLAAATPGYYPSVSTDCESTTTLTSTKTQTVTITHCAPGAADCPIYSTSPATTSTTTPYSSSVHVPSVALSTAESSHSQVLATPSSIVYYNSTTAIMSSSINIVAPTGGLNSGVPTPVPESDDAVTAGASSVLAHAGVMLAAAGAAAVLLF